MSDLNPTTSHLLYEVDDIPPLSVSLSLAIQTVALILAGITLTPDVYACAIDYVGVSNLFTFMNTIPPYWEQFRQMLYEMVGNPDDKEDNARMKATSPVYLIDKIKAPLLIAQGANDPRVAQAESDQMVDALRNNGIDVEYILKTDEGHGFRNEENRFEFYEAMESFLGKYL